MASISRYNKSFAQSWHTTPQGAGYECPRDESPLVLMQKELDCGNSWCHVLLVSSPFCDFCKSRVHLCFLWCSCCSIFSFLSISLYIIIICIILLTCGIHFRGYIISLKGAAWAHKISLTPPLFIEVPVLSSEVMHVCVNGVDFTFFYDFDIWFWNCSESVVFFILHFVDRRRGVGQ